jgi:predicted ATPase
MKVTSIKLTNVRSIMTAELRFQPGFNVVVGENGVGKTTLIDALAICLFEFERVYNRSNVGAPKPFSDDDIRVEAESLDVGCSLDAARSSYHFVVHQIRSQSEMRPGRKGFIGAQPPVAPSTRPEIEAVESQGRPLAVMYSPTRAVRLAVTERWPPKPMGGVSRAYEGALSDREVPLGYFANWMRVRQTFNAAALIGVERAARRFLPGYGHLHLGGSDDRTLLIDRHGASLPVLHLSHGERSILAVVLDLTRRLGEANPGLTDPAAEAGAVVLMDEIDLLLHPKWQRQIARKLTETFPRCQFIATTHSPQVIGEVEHDRIQILTEDGAFSPTHSFGVDSSRVLEEIMEADPRTREVLELLARINGEIDRDAFERARRVLDQLIEKVGSDDPEVTRIRTLLEFLDEDE